MRSSVPVYGEIVSREGQPRRALSMFLGVALALTFHTSANGQTAPPIGAEAAYVLSEASRIGELSQAASGTATTDPDFEQPFPSGGLLDERTSPNFPVSFFVFANERGKVRAASTASRGSAERSAGKTTLTWSGTFRKGAADTASFFVNRSFLTLFIDRPVTLPDPPSAYLQMKVTLVDKTAIFVQTGTNDDGTPVFALTNKLASVQFKHEARMQGVRDSRIAGLALEKTTLFDAPVFDVHSGFVGVLDQQVVKRTLDVNEGVSSYEMEPHRGTIDLSGIPDQGIFVVKYELIIIVSKQAGGENETMGFLGDPLDVDSGFSFETTAEPVEDDDAAESCVGREDPRRYTFNLVDGTVIDTYTGLMWQRCPVGHSLDANGTTDNTSDDRCDANGDTSVNWQAALQASIGDSTSGRSDWRVPNLKELESIVEPNCALPALNNAVFPRSAVSSLWSSTPSPLNGAAAMSLELGFAETLSTLKTTPADVLPVRTTDQPPVQPLPGVAVGRPVSVTEGDAATTNLLFPIQLDAPANADVSIDFETGDRTAIAGEDYTASSGTVVIPAGADGTEVQVAVLGDTVGEDDEVLLLSLTSISDNSWLRTDSAIGEIDDDEPRVSIQPAAATEGDAGATPLSFTVALSEAAPAGVTIDFATTDGTAIAGSDYTAAAGTVAIPAGATSGNILVQARGDQLTEGDESFTLVLSGVSPNARLSPLRSQALGTIVDDDTVTLRALNDTGITLCANETSPALACTQTAAFPGQDAQFGRDATANNDADGAAGFSFTKLDAGGTPLIDQTVAYTVTPWDCVQDEVTGLQWEVKTDDGSLRDKEWTYTWFNSTGINDGGSAGTANGGVCVDSSNCDTEKYVSAVNAVGMCGRSDWRLATREELQSIGDISEFNLAPRYDINFFPNPPTALGASEHWTSTPDASVPAFAWSVNKLKGRSFFIAKSRAFPVRLVRGGN